MCDRSVSEVITHEVPEDDVPDEYLNGRYSIFPIRNEASSHTING
jgi:hypothetical protein